MRFMGRTVTLQAFAESFRISEDLALYISNCHVEHGLAVSPGYGAILTREAGGWLASRSVTLPQD